MTNHIQEHMNLLLKYSLGVTNELNDLKQENLELRAEIKQLNESSTAKIGSLEERLEGNVEAVLHNINNKLSKLANNRLSNDVNSGFQRMSKTSDGNLSLTKELVAKKDAIMRYFRYLFPSYKQFIFFHNSFINLTCYLPCKKVLL